MNHLEKIEEIKNHPDVIVNEYYSSEAEMWKYYESIIGTYKGYYFRIVFSNGYSNIDKVQVSVFTDEREKFIKDFELC